MMGLELAIKLSDLLLIETLKIRDCYYHLTDWKTEAQTHRLRSQSPHLTKPAFESMESGSSPYS